MSNPLENEPFENERLERYLAEISKPLAEPQRSEWREEVRQHLESLIVAHQELGRTRAEAVEAAIATFGEAQIIGKGVQREAVRPGNPSWQVALYGVVKFMTAIVPGFITLGALAASFALVGGEENLANLGRVAAAFGVVFPMFAGWVVGRKASPNHLRRDLLIVPTLGYFASLPMAMIFSCLHQPDWKPDLREVALWFPAALGAAWLSYVLCRDGVIKHRQAGETSGYPRSGWD